MDDRDGASDDESDGYMELGYVHGCHKTYRAKHLGTGAVSA